MNYYTKEVTKYLVELVAGKTINDRRFRMWQRIVNIKSHKRQFTSEELNLLVTLAWLKRTKPRGQHTLETVLIEQKTVWEIFTRWNEIKYPVSMNGSKLVSIIEARLNRKLSNREKYDVLAIRMNEVYSVYDLQRCWNLITLTPEKIAENFFSECPTQESTS